MSLRRTSFRGPSFRFTSFHRWSLLLLTALVASAHVGTDNVVMEGVAGGYPIRVMIAPPGVVPAQVPITVRVLSGTPTRVTVRAAQWNVGTKGAPPAEVASRVPGEAGLWSHDLWIMTASTYAVYVSLEGPAGNGSLVVPMQSSATRTLGMERVMGAILLVLGTLLVAGVLTIVSAAAREGSLPPGERPAPARARTARFAVATAAGVLALALFGGARWWNAEEADYMRSLYRPIASASTVRLVDDARLLTVAMTDTLWHTARFSPLIPDHGKMMHLFLVRVDDAGVIAHLHPVRIHPDSFQTRLPALPGGRYMLFADLLLQSGAQRTLVDTIDVPVAAVVAGAGTTSLVSINANALTNVDRDDAWREVAAVSVGTASVLAGGGTMTLATDAPVAAGRDLRLSATIVNADGSPSTLEPYMGMGGHAMVLRADGSLFMHLHPMGTASMTAQSQLMRRERGDTARLDSATSAAAIATAESQSMTVMHGSPHVTPTPGSLSFPFAFPRTGDYRIFVQVKRQGVVETAAFRVIVTDSVRTRPE